MEDYLHRRAEPALGEAIFENDGDAKLRVAAQHLITERLRVPVLAEAHHVGLNGHLYDSALPQLRFGREHAPSIHEGDAQLKQIDCESLVHLARSANPELQGHVASAFYMLAEQQAPKTWLLQSGCVPCLFAYIRNGDAEVRYLAAKALLYMK